jgi:formamidopyrimidine-DNA glycosylase
MPELPEVETTLRGIEPHVLGRRIAAMELWRGDLRWPVPTGLPHLLEGAEVQSLSRRGKYLLAGFSRGTVLIHLGMSGSLRLTPSGEVRRKHDHWQWPLDEGLGLRYHDPRRFGALLWSDRGEEHPLLANLGPEPLSDDFSGHYLWQQSRGRRQPVKAFIMDSHLVVGVGNIYASESLYRAGIHPFRPAGRISRVRYQRLEDSVRGVLQDAIASGGSTLRDYVNGSGNPGYFQQQLDVYGRSGLPCRSCGSGIRMKTLGQRATFYCRNCQH